MTENPSAEKVGVYPVQPTFIAVREIHFISHRPPSKDDKIDQTNIKVTVEATDFSEESKRIQVTLSATYGFSEDSKYHPPYSVKVVLTGEFAIDDSFPREKITLWAHKNAPFVIFPYLRERLYYIAVQAGYPPIILPLLQIPTFTIVIPKTEALKT